MGPFKSRNNWQGFIARNGWNSKFVLVTVPETGIGEGWRGPRQGGVFLGKLSPVLRRKNFMNYCGQLRAPRCPTNLYQVRSRGRRGYHVWG